MNSIILENFPEIANELSYILLSFGIKGITVSHRNEALKILADQPDIKLGIIDIDNKALEGLELIEDIHKQYGSSFRLIVHSAAAIEEMPPVLENKNIVGYIGKPFDTARVEGSLKIIFSPFNFPDIEKREHLRIIPDKDDLLRINFKLKGYAHLVCGKIINLSLGGVAAMLLNLSGINLMKEGTAIPRMEFTLNCKLVVTTGIIILQRGKFVAVHFNPLDRETRNILAKYILKRIY